MTEEPRRICGNCGNQLSPEDQVCQNCGTPVHRGATVPTPEADVPLTPPPQAGEAGAAPQEQPPQADTPGVVSRVSGPTRESTETKSAYKTTELIVYLLAVAGVLVASALVDDSFGADPAWRYVIYLTVGYMISRGLAKSGSREPYRD